MIDTVVHEFLERISRSGLIPAAVFEAVVRALPAELLNGPTHALAAHLQDQQLLTPWQAKMLLRGHSGGFFVGKYKLLNEIARGPLSCVFLAEHVALRRKVAIKLLSPKCLQHRSRVARFHRESRAMGALDHPHIAKVYDFDEGANPYLVLEYVDGPDIEKLVEQGGPLPWREALTMLRQAAAALAHMHEQDLVHRDVKPANLLTTRKGLVKVGDLGLAKLKNHKGPSLTVDNGTVLGTIDYLAPEQALDSHTVTGKADVYGLGCTLCYMVTGRPPFPTGSMAVRLVKHQHEPPQPLSASRPGLPPFVDELYRQMLAKKPEDRPSAAEVARRVGIYLDVQAAGMSLIAAPAKASIVAPAKAPLPSVNAWGPPAGVTEPMNERAKLLADLLGPPAATDGSVLDDLSQDVPRGAPGNFDFPSDRPSAQSDRPNPIADRPSSIMQVNQNHIPGESTVRMRTECRHCGTPVFAPPTAVGRKAKCPRCDQVFVIQPPQSFQAGKSGILRVATASDTHVGDVPGGSTVNSGLGKPTYGF